VLSRHLRRGKTLAAVYFSPDYTIQLWSVPEGERVLSIKGAEETRAFSKVVYSPDGLFLASVASVDDRMDHGMAEVWRASDGEPVLTLELTGVSSIAYAPDGQTLASGSYDHTVRLWQASDGKLLSVLQGHADYVTDVAFSPEENFLASGSSDGTVILWGLGDGE
jgi:WD40 repeat protein